MAINTFPCENGDVLDADTINAENTYNTLLESINQNTILSADATITDKSYTYASSDVFSDSNGYNNTVGAGTTSTQRGTFSQNACSKGSVIVQDNDENSVTGGYAKVKTLTVNDYVWEVTNEIAVNPYQGNSAVCYMVFNYADGTTKDSVIHTTGGAYVVKTYTNPINKEVATIDVYLAGGTPQAYFASEKNDTVYGIGSVADRVLITNSKTFSSNVKSILVNANKILNGNSTITVDVSSDGGSTWDVEDGALNKWLELDGDDTDIVVKFNLNVDSGNAPELYGYSYMVWL